MQLVPFQPQWAGSETKLDLKGIYRRPSTDGGISLTGALPLRRNNDWQRKGFEFVSLATLEDLGLVHRELRAAGYDVDEIAKAYDKRTGAFLVDAYLLEEGQKSDAFLEDLQAKVDKFGADTVVEMMRVQNPGFVLPASLRVPAPSDTPGAATPDEPRPDFAPEPVAVAAAAGALKKDKKK